MMIQNYVDFHSMGVKYVEGVSISYNLFQSGSNKKRIVKIIIVVHINNIIRMYQ